MQHTDKSFLFAWCRPLFVNHLCCRKVPVLGKHMRRIICGAWSRTNLLALGSEDRSISISNADGDTVRQLSGLGEPSLIQFSEMKQDERSQIGDNTVCLKKMFASDFTHVKHFAVKSEK